jgi:hypothetical protein
MKSLAVGLVVQPIGIAAGPLQQGLLCLQPYPRQSLPQLISSPATDIPTPIAARFARCSCHLTQARWARAQRQTSAAQEPGFPTREQWPAARRREMVAPQPSRWMRLAVVAASRTQAFCRHTSSARLVDHTSISARLLAALCALPPPMPRRHPIAVPLLPSLLRRLRNGARCHGFFSRLSSLHALSQRVCSIGRWQTLGPDRAE